MESAILTSVRKKKLMFVKKKLAYFRVGRCEIVRRIKTETNEEDIMSDL